MSAAGFTPIQLYRTTTAAAVPSAGNLADGELAINLTDEALYFKNASGVVKLLADSSGALGTVTSVDASGGTTGLTFSGGPITSSGTLTLGGTLGVANGGTGAATLSANGVLLGNGTSAVTAVVGTTGRVLAGNTGLAPTFEPISSLAVSSISFGSTGLTPATATQGAVTVGGTLNVANGGTGATSLTSGYVLKGNGTSAVSASVIYDNGTSVGVGTASPTASIPLTVLADSGNAIAQNIRGRSDGIGVLLFTDNADAENGRLDFRTNYAEIKQSRNAPLVLSTNNTERMRIDSSGNVGIGTSSPGFKLDIASGDIRLSNTQGIRWGTSDQAFIFGDDGAGGGFLRFGVNSEWMRITDSGNVGIGNTNPTTKLWVGSSGGGSGTATPDAICIGNTFANTAGDPAKMKLRLFDENGGNLYGFGVSANLMETHVPSGASMAWYTGGTERMRIDSSGNVGVGLTGPQLPLTIGKGGGAPPATSGSTQSSGGIARLGSSGAATLDVGILSSGSAWLQATNVTDLASNFDILLNPNGGNVGIGTSSPADKLSVNSAAGSGAVGSFINTSNGSSLGGVVSSINAGGNNTNSWHYIGVTQTVAIWYLYGNGTTSYTSDIRVKKNIETTRDGYLDDVSKLRVVKYNWYNDSDDTPRELGFIAQEVEQVFPGLVQDAAHPTKDGVCHKVLKASVLVPILTKALQEANAKIDALAARVAQLEGN